MTLKKVIFYYENDKGELLKAELDGDQFFFAYTQLKDYNAFLYYLDYMIKWKLAGREINE